MNQVVSVKVSLGLGLSAFSDGFVVNLLIFLIGLFETSLGPKMDQYMLTATLCCSMCLLFNEHPIEKLQSRGSMFYHVFVMVSYLLEIRDVGGCDLTSRYPYHVSTTGLGPR